MENLFSELLQSHKNFIFIGETGSGKSEIALNTAVMLRHAGHPTVHLFDLDQTKAMFRARDAEAIMTQEGVAVHYVPQLLDAPVIVNGILPHLQSAHSICVLDVGGNENAARMAGGFCEVLSQENTAAIYVLNPYRPWSGSADAIQTTMEQVLRACRLQKVYLVANPNTGAATSLEDFQNGVEQLKRLMGESVPFFGTFIRKDLYEQIPENERGNLYPLQLYLTYPWLSKQGIA